MLLPSSNRIGLDNDDNASIIMILSIYIHLLQSRGGAIQYYQFSEPGGGSGGAGAKKRAAAKMKAEAAALHRTGLDDIEDIP